jgi:cytoskeletal protein CcmA (bactofilin family)
VGGKVEAGADLGAYDVEVGGSVRAKSVTATTKIEVGGSITSDVGVNAATIEIGRRGEVVGPIRADEVIIGDRARVEDVHARSILMEERASARNLYGETIRIEEHCQISGEVQYTRDLRAEENVEFAKPPQKVDKLPT